MEEGKKKVVAQVVLFIVVFTIGFFGTKYVMSSFNSGNSELKKAVADMNKDCPKLIDAETSLDSATTFDNTFQYHFTLFNFSKGDPELDIESVKKGIQFSAQENYDTNPTMAGFREKDIELKYSYKDKDGKDLFDFTIKTNKK
jgi:hypothetical protein